MARLTIYRDHYADSTVVSNCFIDEYMEDANDAQIKVYLYLIRMLNAGQATSVSDIADKFNHTEKDVLRALNYWEKKQLLSLDYDMNRNLTGIHLRDLSRSEAGSGYTASAIQDNPAAAPVVQTTSAPVPVMQTTSAPVPVMQTASAPVPVMQAASAPVPVMQTVSASAPARSYAFPQNPQQTAALQIDAKEQPGVPASGYTAAPVTAQPAQVREFAPVSSEARFPQAKPSFSIDQIREFKNREETAQLLFITESYIGRPLTPNEMKSILYFKDVLRFSDDLIDYLIQYCVDRGKKDFKYIEKVAVNWAEEGITTPAQAQQASSRYDRNVYTIMNMLGKNNAPTPKEVEYITRWTRDYGFSNDIILEACERTVLATDKHRFEYAEGILSSWKRQDVHHKTDIHRIDDLYEQKRRSAAKPASSNKFNQFTQNSYDFDELERELLSN